ncbi:hypothetical protein ABQX22_18210 [Xanthomonas sp. WHRI 1810A]|uniref:hypothetical protein n=1 Tax=Xanthomonas sp. WHRI 1810A TaxID=3161565 RepID=UPI0032E8DE79
MSLESDRRSGGGALVAERQSIGASVSRDRGGSGAQVSDDLNRLVTAKRQATTLPVLQARGAVPATKGKGTYNPKNVPTTSGGIASPLTETDFTKREYWSNGLLSSDGLFTIPSIKKLVLTDANGGEAVINLAQPITPE